MEKAVVILAHPDMKGSRVNKRWKEELLKHDSRILVHDLYEEYRDYNIDITREQKLLEEYNKIILQFPFYWYSSPPLLKKWMDEVLEYGWAYGDDEGIDYNLKNKKIGIAVSVGGPEEEYNKKGLVSYTMDELLSPFLATINYIGAIHKGNFILFDAVPETPDNVIGESAKKYIEFILEKE